MSGMEAALSQTSGAFELGRPPKKVAADMPARLRAEFGQKLREARAAADMSQGDVSRATGIDPSDISKIEAGARNISIETMARLAAAVHLDISLLLTPNPPPRKK